MNKPEKLTDYKQCTMGGHTEENCDHNILAKAEMEAHNKACDVWEKYIESHGGKIECDLLHEDGCQCENDE